MSGNSSIFFVGDDDGGVQFLVNAAIPAPQNELTEYAHSFILIKGFATNYYAILFGVDNIEENQEQFCKAMCWYFSVPYQANHNN